MEFASRFEDSFFQRHTAARHKQRGDKATRRYWSAPDMLVANWKHITGFIATPNN